MKCIIIDDDKVSRMLIENFINKTDTITLAQSFDNALDAINYLNEAGDVGLVFLDIEMPEMNGLELLETSDSLPQIIIVSSEEKYALKAIEHAVTDYLVKPISYARFFRAVNKVIEKNDEINEEEKPKGIFIKSSSSSFVRLLYDEILWIEALENYVVINTEKEKYTIHFTMKSILKKLPANIFKRIHRSYIININKLSIIEDNMVIIHYAGTKKTIPIAKSYKDKLMKDINVVVR